MAHPHVYKKFTSHRGNGIFASKDISPKTQILRIAEPLIIALQNDRLDNTCYQCFRSPDQRDSPPKPGSNKIELKGCAGCKTVKFCDKQCQKIAWNRYHKLECKLYAQWSPRVLPVSARALIRLLARRAANLVSDEEWNELLALEGHEEAMSSTGGENWQDLFLLMKAVKKYSGTKESNATILSLCAKLMVNSFTLATSSFDHLGVILHPFAALANHSCEPNAAVCFDKGPFTASSPLFGTISLYALRKIEKGEEVTISYIDTTMPYSQRQSSLAARYFFTCSCSLCSKGLETMQDKFLALTGESSTTSLSTVLSGEASLSVSEVQSKTETLLQHVENKSGSEKDFIPQIREALCTLGRTKVWPIYRYPFPQLRQLLVLGLLDRNRTSESAAEVQEALAHSAVMHLVDSRFFSGMAHHPVAIAHKYTYYCLAMFACSEPNEPAWAESIWKLSICLLRELHHDMVLDQPHMSFLELMVAQQYSQTKNYEYTFPAIEVDARKMQEKWAEQLQAKEREGRVFEMSSV